MERKAHLVDQETQQTYPLVAVTNIGRASSCEVLLADPKVSRRHAMIRLEDGIFWLYDLGSFNGCTVNGYRVQGGHPLLPGDVIEMAGHILRFELNAGQSAQAAFDDPGVTMSYVQIRPAVVLVSDVKGFTTLSEGLSPEVLAQLMGRWYRRCHEVIRHHGGAVDKFSGDAVQGYWMDVSAESRARALRAAQMLLNRSALSSTLHAQKVQDLPEISCGAALHVGEVAYGGMGGGERTLLGDCVNVAHRLQALTRSLAIPLLVTAEFLDGWPEADQAFQSHGDHTVKGRARPVAVYSPR